jgi:undecaprenyl-diphosphatase
MEAVARSHTSAFVRSLSWLGGHERGTLLAVAGIGAGIWIFGWLAGEVFDGDTRNFDRRLLLAMRSPEDLALIGPPAVQQAARDITALGSAAVLGLLTAITGVYLALDGKRHMALFMCGSVISGWMVSALLKDLFQRPRPDLVPYGVSFSSTSFPSGHSMMSAVTYLVLGALLARSQVRALLKAYFLLVAVMLTLMVGISRVYLGVHWPSDVVAGWTAGAVWALLSWLVAQRLQARHALEREAEHIPSGANSATSRT